MVEVAIIRSSLSDRQFRLHLVFSVQQAEQMGKRRKRRRE